MATKPIKQIGIKLQKQYETWQRRARYKQSLDPTIDEVSRNFGVTCSINVLQTHFLFVLPFYFILVDCSVTGEAVVCITASQC